MTWLPGCSHGDMPINSKHVQTEQPELTVQTLPACMSVSLQEPVCWPLEEKKKMPLKTVSEQTKDPLASLYLSWHCSMHPSWKPSLGGVRVSGGGNQSCASPGDTAQHQDKPWNLPNNTHGKGPCFPRWFTVKHRANTLTNNGATKSNIDTGKSANQRYRKSAWSDLRKANRSPTSANTAVWNILQQWRPFFYFLAVVLISTVPQIRIGTELDWKQSRVDYLTKKTGPPYCAASCKA